MKAYEFPTRVMPGGKIQLPGNLQNLPHDQVVRIIVLVSDPEDQERADWAYLTAEQFLAGYAASDAIYDRI